MPHRVSPEIRELCRAHDVEIDPEASFGIVAPRAIAIEAPGLIYKGVYDIELIGGFTYIGARNTCMLHIGTIGRFSSIAANVQTGYSEHSLDMVSTHPFMQGDPLWIRSAGGFFERNWDMILKSHEARQARRVERFGRIQIGNDVWIGEGVFIRAGVEIGDGAVIGARAVVMHDVPPYAIVVGAPARIIRYRFEQEVIDEFQRLQWWLYGLSALEGVDFTNIDMALWRISENIESGLAQIYDAPILNVAPDSVEVLRFDPETGTFAAS